MTALERLSKIQSVEDFKDWKNENDGYECQLKDIQEVVSLAKENQQPSIDAMRFEAAKAVLQGLVSHPTIKDTPENFVSSSIQIADLLMAELQKTSK